MIKNPLHLIDFYKADHRRQYPAKTELVYSNFTPRSNQYGITDKVVVFGVQYFVKEYLIDVWNKGFFEQPLDVVLKQYKRRMDNSLGKDAIPVDHIEELHNLGYLPIIIKALPEGTLCPIGVPMLTICNTEPKFFWLTNYLESLMSNVLWKPMTSATTAYMYRKEFERHAELTGSPKDFIGWQGHDFSFRGMSGVEDSVMSGAGHLLSFTGTDTVHAIDFLEEYYNADSDKELVGGSVPATEHSVMCMGGDGEDEFETFKRLITETYPTGVVSIVSDTWDFWKVITEYLPRLKDVIIARDGRVVIRPDSGDPVHIICGVGKDVHINPYMSSRGDYEDHERKGAYECLMDTFGYEVNDKGYKVLNPKVGLIYGDSITYDRQKEILKRLENKKMTASNLVLGIGSFTYEYVTRDTYGFAMKATYGEVDGESRDIYKDPKTDDGTKKSARGLLQVLNGELKDQCNWAQETLSDLKVVYENGKLVKDFSLAEIRNNLSKY